MYKFLLVTSIILCISLFIIPPNSDTLATRMKKIHHGGSSLGGDIVPYIGTHLIIRQRGIKCAWDDTASMLRAIKWMYDADSLTVRDIELNEDGTVLADIYINGVYRYDSVMQQGFKCREGE